LPEIKPFRAVRYNKSKVPDLSLVVAPPYDIIPKKTQDELYRRDAHNVVRLILNRITPKDTPRDNRYTRSKKFFDKWLEDDILIRDSADSFYVYSQKYKQDGKNIEQIGFIGLMALDLGGKKVLPHENTLAAPKEDRLELMRAVRANLSPIFILYDDGDTTGLLKKFRAENKPVADVVWEGARHTVWQLSDPAVIKKIRSRMKAKGAFIADGHHRYEVAKLYAKESRENPKYMMVYFVEADEKMVTVLPAHRLIRDLGGLGKSAVIERLKRSFSVKKVPGLRRMMAELAGRTGDHLFGAYLGKGDFYILKLEDEAASDVAIKNKPEEWKRLDVSILHLFIFQRVLGVKDTDDNIEFLKSPLETVRGVDGGKFKAAFFLNPTKVSQVKRIASLGARMPRKATYFYPKPLSGLVINKF